MWSLAWDRMQQGAMTQTAEAIAAIARSSECVAWPGNRDHGTISRAMSASITT
jgi:hypothetical protein